MATTTTDYQETTETFSFLKTEEVHLRSVASLVLSVSYALLAALAAHFMALSSQAGVPGLQLLFVMQLAELLCVLVVLPFFRPRLTAEDTLQGMILFLSAVIDNLGTVLAFMSYIYVVPGLAVGVIQGLVPFSTACVGYIFLKERVGVVDSCCILCSVAGVALVTVGMTMGAASSTHVQWLTVAILLPFAAAFFEGPNNVITRFLIDVQGVSILTDTFYTQLLGTVLLLPGTFLFETPRWTMSAPTIGYVIGLCLCDFFSVLSLKLVLKLEKAGVAAVFMTLVIPFTILLDYLLQSHVHGPMELGGITLVVIGTAVVGGHSWWGHRQKMRRNDLLETMNFDKST
ncbi:solute carrier family 35 member G2-like [Branchiostoma floridae x Branchiostoma japonicum]